MQKAKVSLIICTYMRPDPLSRLLESVMSQTKVPDEVLIIDGSIDDTTECVFRKIENSIINYYKVPPQHRGLTKQRNYGIERVDQGIDIVAFLDDDTILTIDYFENLEKAFTDLPDASGIGGTAINENRWQLKENKRYHQDHFYEFGNHVVKESSRNVLRNKLKLASNELPGIMPAYSHGRTFSYPITGENYPVDLIVGMSMAFRKEVTDSIKFSRYFEGYGLYEDADYSIRALDFGQNYLATSVRLEHHHDAAGRPNTYAYGKMVVRNGWYVWRVKHPKPSFQDKLKWYQITLLLTFIRFINIFTTSQRQEAFTEFLGRTSGIISLFFKSPK